MGLRVHPSEFQKLNLRCHTLLGDALLHDVWAIPLDDGGQGRSIRDARAILFGDRRPPANMAVRALFKLRSALGRMFGWDDQRHDPPVASYIHRLADVDRAQSQVSPGTREGPFRVLYVLGDEALSELRNATVHAFLVLALTPRPRGGHALPGVLREASESFYVALPRDDRPVSPLYCLPRARSPGTARLVTREFTVLTRCRILRFQTSIKLLRFPN